MRILITLICAAFPFQAAANVDCSVIDALERVQFAQIRLANLPQVDVNAVDAQLIMREIGRLDSGKIKFASASTLNAADQARLVAFYENAAMLRRTLMSQDKAQAQNMLRALAFKENIVHTARIIPLFKCNALTGVRGTDGLEKVSSTIGQSKPARKITITSAGLWLVGVVVAIVVAMQIRSVLMTYQTRKRRRSKRYRVHIESKLRAHDTTQNATILDISCNGVKIQTDLTEHNKIGDSIDIWINLDWKSGHITWSNAHYIGVRFTQPLKHAYVMSLHDDEVNSLRKNKNGARSGAAFNSQK